MTATAAPAQANKSAVDTMKEKLAGVQVPDGMTQMVDSVKGDKKKMMIAGGAAALVLILIIVGISSLFGGGAEGAVDDFMDAMINEATDDYLDAMSDDLRDELSELYADGDEDDLYDYLEYVGSSFMDSLEDECGRNVVVTYTVDSVDELRESKLEDLIDDVDDRYRVDVTDAREVTVEYEAEGKDDDYDDDMELVVLEIEGEWVVFMGYIDY